MGLFPLIHNHSTLGKIQRGVALVKFKVMLSIVYLRIDRNIR